MIRITGDAFIPSFEKHKCTNCNNCQTDCSDPATLPFRYLRPDLTLTFHEIKRRRDDNLQSLLSCKKLQLILDLDHTLVHSLSMYDGKLTSQEIERVEAMDDAHQIFFGTYLVKLRPGAREFLEQVSSMYHLSVFTLSGEEYARKVVSILDSEDGPSRITWVKDGPSRFTWVIAEEHCVNENQKGLDMVLSHENVVLIVDDTEKVWEESGSENLIKISPYYFFPMEEEAKQMDKELRRVLSILRAVHSFFYEDGEVDYGKRDVRELLKRVLTEKTEEKMVSDMKKIRVVTN